MAQNLGTADLYFVISKGSWGSFPQHVAKVDNLIFNTGSLKYS